MSFSKMFDHLDRAIDRTVTTALESSRSACESVGALAQGDVGKAASKAAEATGGLITGGLDATAQSFKAGNQFRRGVLSEAETLAREISDPLGDVVVIVAEATGGAADD